MPIGPPPASDCPAQRKKSRHRPAPYTRGRTNLWIAKCAIGPLRGLPQRNAASEAGDVDAGCCYGESVRHKACATLTPDLRTCVLSAHNCRCSLTGLERTGHALLADEIRARRVLDRRSRRGARARPRRGSACATIRRAISCATRCRSATACSSTIRAARSRASPASPRSGAGRYPDATQFDRKSPYYDPRRRATRRAGSTST